MQRFMVIGDLYNRIFAIQTSNPDVVVDYEQWNAIFRSLPEGYSLPDLPLIQLLETTERGGASQPWI